MTNIKNILTFKGVDKAYKKGGAEIYALKNVSFSLEPGKSTLITGPSGAGKTTLIYLAGLMKKPSSGEISINEIGTRNLNENERSNLIRNEIGFIFRRSNLIGNLSVLENVMLPQISSNVEKAQKLLEKVGISKWNRFPCDLSLEEEQKVTLARSMANDPSLILADEPTGELDNDATYNFLNILNKIDNIGILMTSDNDSLSESFNQTYKLEESELI